MAAFELPYAECFTHYLEERLGNRVSTTLYSRADGGECYKVMADGHFLGWYFVGDWWMGHTDFSREYAGKIPADDGKIPDGKNPTDYVVLLYCKDPVLPAASHKRVDKHTSIPFP